MSNGDKFITNGGEKGKIIGIGVGSNNGKYLVELESNKKEWFLIKDTNIKEVIR